MIYNRSVEEEPRSFTVDAAAVSALAADQELRDTVVTLLEAMLRGGAIVLPHPFEAVDVRDGEIIVRYGNASESPAYSFDEILSALAEPVADLMGRGRSRQHPKE